MNQNMSGNVQLNDEQRMEDLLTGEKHMIGTYGSFVPEAACPNLTRLIGDFKIQKQQLQNFAIFMNQKHLIYM